LNNNNKMEQNSSLYSDENCLIINDKRVNGPQQRRQLLSSDLDGDNTIESTNSPQTTTTTTNNNNKNNKKNKKKKKNPLKKIFNKPKKSNESEDKQTEPIDNDETENEIDNDLTMEEKTLIEQELDNYLSDDLIIPIDNDSLLLKTEQIDKYLNELNTSMEMNDQRDDEILEKFRELSISRYGLINKTYRQKIWPLLILKKERIDNDSHKKKYFNLSQISKFVVFPSY
jgi:hypothetical protein